MIRLTFIFMVYLTFLSCTHDHGHNHSHDEDHHHDDVKLLITAYGKGFEVFAEADPFSPGRNSEILVHISHLENFKPLTAGKVTMSMITGERGIRQTREGPEKAGIYRFRLQPESAGMANVFFDIEYGGEVLRIDGGSFRIYADEHAAIHAAEELLPDHPAPVSFSKEQSWLVDFGTAEVMRESLGIVIKTVGKVMPARGDEIVLTATTNGLVIFVSNLLYEGTEVKEGEVLLNVSGEGLAEGNAALRYQEARNNYEKAKAGYDRMKPLAEAQIVSQREWISAKSDYENARAIYQMLSANFSQSGQVLRSPINGHLVQILVNQGQYVEAGQPVAILARNSEIVIKSEVQQQYASHLSNISTANIADAQGNAYTLDAIGGKVLSYGRNTSPENHLLPVYLSVNNQPGWVTGTLLDIYLKTNDPQIRVVAPNMSLIEEQGSYFVFVQLHPESFEKREVFTGITDGLHTEILRGLKENERIVSRGAMLVKMAAASAELDPHAGHMH
jgi:membrane fusion protein, heavy metal efflux system